MANANLLEYRIHINRNGVAELAADLAKVEGSTDSLTSASAGAGTALDKMQGTAKNAGAGVAQIAQASEQAGAELQQLRQAVDAKTAAIKAGLQVEQSEIELQRRHLEMAREEQQAIVRAAAARGDEAAATQAQNRLRAIEADQLGLVARAKRAEAAAVQQAVDARREELSAVGPLTAAQDAEIRAAENHARALRVEAAAADQAAARSRDLTNAHKGNAAATDQLGARVQGLSQLLGQMAGALGAAFSFRELVTAAAQMESLRSGLTAVTQDAAKAGKELEFVRTVANRIGADVTEVGKAFLGLAASTRGTAVEGEPTRQVFEAVATAMGKAGKSSAETANALQALSQMASKGVVQSEELRGQLGEALPGALNAAAKGLGITTAELMKLVEEGKITAQDIFPALAKGLNELYSGATAVKTLTQELTNVKNAATSFAEGIGEAGGMSFLKRGAQETQAAFAELESGFISTGKTIGVVLGALRTMDFSGVKEAFADIEAESRDKLAKAALNNEILRNAIKEGSNEALKAALAHQEAGQASATAGAAAAASADNWVRLNNGYRLVLESVREQITEAEKSVLARDAEGKASVALAQAFGTEKEQREAQVSAAAANAEALQKLAQLRLTELASMQAQLKTLQEEAKASSAASDERKKQIAELEKQIGLRQQDADKAVAQAQASRLAAEHAKAEAEAYRDNSGRVEELRSAYERAKAKLEEVRAAKQAGLAATSDLIRAENEAGRAALLYRDALSDQLQLIRAKSEVQRSAIDVQSLEVRLAIEQQRSIMEVARARGDERGAMLAAAEIRKLEIQLLELQAQAKRAEADAALASVEVKRAELIASGQLTEAKRLELDAAVKAAQARKIEAQIAEATAQKLRDLGNAGLDTHRGLSRAGEGAMAAGKAFAAMGIEASGAVSEIRRLDAAGQALAAEHARRAKAVSDSSITNRPESASQGVWNRQLIIDSLKSSGLDEMLAVKLSERFVDSNGNVAYTAGDEQKRWAGRWGSLSDALAKMSEYYKYDTQGRIDAEQMIALERSNRQQSGQTPAIPATQPTRRSQASSGSSGGVSGGATYISNITLPGPGGRRETLRFADADSQASNERLLRDLAAARGVAQR